MEVSVFCLPYICWPCTCCLLQWGPWSSGRGISCCSDVGNVLNLDIFFFWECLVCFTGSSLQCDTKSRLLCILYFAISVTLIQISHCFECCSNPLLNSANFMLSEKWTKRSWAGLPPCFQANTDGETTICVPQLLSASPQLVAVLWDMVDSNHICTRLQPLGLVSRTARLTATLVTGYFSKKKCRGDFW